MLKREQFSMYACFTSLSNFHTERDVVVLLFSPLPIPLLNIKYNRFWFRRLYILNALTTPLTAIIIHCYNEKEIERKSLRVDKNVN